MQSEFTLKVCCIRLAAVKYILTNYFENELCRILGTRIFIVQPRCDGMMDRGFSSRDSGSREMQNHKTSPSAINSVRLPSVAFVYPQLYPYPHTTQCQGDVLCQLTAFVNTHSYMYMQQTWHKLSLSLTQGEPLYTTCWY